MPAVTTRRTAQCRKPVYPDFQNTRHFTDPLYWLACWQRSLAQGYAAYRLRRSGATVRSPALDDALWIAEKACREAAVSEFGHLMQFGGLLFAWEGTTALTTEGGAA